MSTRKRTGECAALAFDVRRLLPLALLALFVLAAGACSSGGSATSGDDVSGEDDTLGHDDTLGQDDAVTDAGEVDAGPSSTTPIELQLTPPNPTLAADTSIQLTTMGIFADATHADVTGYQRYTSSDPAVATVDAAGVVTAVGEGTAEITATFDPALAAPQGDPVAAGLQQFQGALASPIKCLVKVTKATLVSISVTPVNKFVTVGTTRQYKAVGLFSNKSKQDLTSWVTWSSSAPTVATFTATAGLVQGVALGTATLTATHPTLGKSGSAVVTVKAPTLTKIQVTPGNLSTPLEGSVPYTAMGIYSDNTTLDLTSLVTWTSSKPTVATVSAIAGSQGLITLLAPGTTTITAKDPVTGKSGKTTLKVLNVALTLLDINPVNPSAPVGIPLQLLAVETYANGMVHAAESAEMTWTSSNTAVAVVSNAPGSEGLVTPLAVGTATITAVDPETKLAKSVTFTVTNATMTSVQVTPAAPSFPMRHVQKFAALGVFTDLSTRDVTAEVTWTTSDPALAVISNAPGSQGVSASFGPGVVTVTATDPVTGKAGSTVATIQNKEATSINPAPPTASIPVGMTQQFAAWEWYGGMEAYPMESEEEGAEMTWSSSDPTIADVSNAPGSIGLVTALKAGTVTITAIDPESGLPGTADVTVTAATLQSVASVTPSVSVAKGLPHALTVTGTFSDGTQMDLTTTVAWASSNPAVAAVSNLPGTQGVVTTLAPGTAVITATDPLTGLTVTTTVTVTAAILTSIAIDGPAYSLVTGTDTQFMAMGMYSDMTTQDLTAVALWTTADPTVCTAVAGLVTPLGAGTTTLTATDPVTGISGAVTVPVSTPLDPNTLAKFVDPLGFPPIGTPLSTAGGVDYYEHHVTQFLHKWHRDLPASPLWGYNDTCLGPTIVAMQGTPVRIKWFNDLPEKHLIPVDRSIMGMTMGAPEVGIVTHLHGGEVQGKDDGWPKAWIGPGGKTHGPDFVTDTYDYPNLQDAATIWYHDHREGGTRLNVIAGPAAFYLIKDPVDLGLNLPSGAYENGLAIQDRMFKADGSLSYPGAAVNGVLPSIVPEFFGDVITVNGTIWPKWSVEPRKYRMHLLNGSNARAYHLWIDNNGVAVPFQQVGTEQGLMAAPVTLTDLILMPGERVDLVFDFTGLEGTTLTMLNDAPTPYPMGLPVDANTSQIMQIVVDQPLAGPDTSVVPSTLRTLTFPDPATAAQVRDKFLIESVDVQGRLMLSIDGLGFNDPVTETPKAGTVEVWRLINTTPDAHPMHLHLVKFMGLDRQAFDVAQYFATGQVVLLGSPVPVDPNEQGFKDTIRCNVGEVTRIVMQFPAGFSGNYVWHCHILEHEEHDMMRPMTVLP